MLIEIIAIVLCRIVRWSGYTVNGCDWSPHSSNATAAAATNSWYPRP